MFDFIQDILYWFASLQGKSLKRKLKRNTFSYQNSSSKKIFGAAASLELNSKNKLKQQKLDSDIKCILKKYENNPDKLLAFIRRSGTEVHTIPFANKLLAFIQMEEGFIGKTTGLKALYLSILQSAAKRKFVLALTTEPMFILRNLKIDKFYMIQQFHKWYAMKLNLPGFDEKSQENFQKFLSPQNDSQIGTLSVEEILGLKDAIARDIEAIDFVVDLAKSTTGSKNALRKISTGGASV